MKTWSPASLPVRLRRLVKRDEQRNTETEYYDGDPELCVRQDRLCHVVLTQSLLPYVTAYFHAKLGFGGKACQAEVYGACIQAPEDLS